MISRPAVKRAPADVRVPAEILDAYLGDGAAARRAADIVQFTFVLRSTAQRANEAISDWLAEFGLTATTYNVLVFLGASKGCALPLTTLVTHMHTRATNITAIVDSLERAGLVARRANPDDRRSTLAVLTARGRATLKRAMPVQHAELVRVFAGLKPAECAAALDLLVRLNERLQQPRAAQTPAKQRKTARPQPIQ